MMLKEIVPELIVKDVSKSIQFYKEIFGFNVKMTVPDSQPYSWCQMSLNNFNIMMQEHSSICEEINDFPEILSSSNIIVLKFDNTSEVKKLYNRLKNDGISFFTDLKETEYGTVEFGIFDPDNYMILVSAE
ncbi:MAG: VOC family protein [Oscillospiraceae bacterium]|nr:VOC family protein [Oscillospiraceae bacterium]